LTIADTAPASPQVGQQWFDSIGAQTYLWFNDGTSSQWVPVNNPAAMSLPLPVSIANGGTNATTAVAALTNLGAVAKAGDTMTGALTINTNAAAGQPPIAGVANQLRIIGADATYPTFSIDSFGTGNYGLAVFRQARGTGAAPLATGYGDSLLGIQAQGWTGGAYSGSAAIFVTALGNWDAQHQNVEIDFYTVTTPGNGVSVGNTKRVGIGAGVMIGAPAGGDLGPGTINAAGNIVSGGNASLGGAAFPPIAPGSALVFDAGGGPNIEQIIGPGNTGGILLTANLYYDGASWRYRTANQGAIFGASSAAGDFSWFTAPTGTVGGAATPIQTMGLDASANLQIYGPTATKPGGGSWAAPSDMQLKVRDSIAAYTTGLQAINQLQPVTYRYNGTAGLPTDQTFHGLVADDVELVMPEAVGRAVLGQRPALGDDEGEPGEEYRTYDSTPVLYALINSVKEIAARLDKLEAALPPGIGLKPLPAGSK
jgi:hypothetical protein